jgi:hypothetical protein
MRDTYRRAIQRTFADLYSVPADSVDVVWNATCITVYCAGETFVRQTESADGSFVSENEDPVIVTPSEHANVIAGHHR